LITVRLGSLHRIKVDPTGTGANLGIGSGPSTGTGTKMQIAFLKNY
jgi:hypothetical protein